MTQSLEVHQLRCTTVVKFVRMIRTAKGFQKVAGRSKLFCAHGINWKNKIKPVHPQAGMASFSQMTQLTMSGPNFS